MSKPHRYVLAALALVLFAATAAADTNIAVMPFKGQDVDAVQSAVEDVVREEYTAISGARVIGTARKMGLTQASDDNLARVARKMQLDALIYGQLVREGKRLELKVLVRSGRSGEAIGEPFSVRLAGERLEGKQRQEFLDKLAGKLEGVKRMRRPDPNRQDPDSEELVERGGSDDDKNEDSAREDEDSRREREEEEAERERLLGSLTPEQRADVARSRALEISGGFGVKQRSLKFKGGGNLGDLAPPDYSGLMPQVQIDGEVYPWAFNPARTGWKRHTGLLLHFEKSMFLESQSPADPMSTVASTHTRFGLGVVYRMLLGSNPTDATVKFSLGFNKSSFSTAQGALMLDLPNVSYTFVDPGAVLHYPFGEKLAANFTGRALVVLSAGQIQDSTQYGAGTAIGADVDANVSYAIGTKLSVLAGVRLYGFMLDFTKQGEKSDRNLDGQKDINGALDLYMGGYVQAGYWF